MSTLNKEHSCCYFFDTLLQNTSTHSILEELHTKDIQTTLLLFLVWYSTNSFGRITKRDIQTLKTASESWHNNVVKALSRLANTVSSAQISHDISQEAHNLNQFALKAEMEMLEKTLHLKEKPTRSIEQQLNDCCHNLIKYLSTINTKLDDHLEHNIRTILRACFPSDLHGKIEEEILKRMDKNRVNAVSTQQRLCL